MNLKSKKSGTLVFGTRSVNRYTPIVLLVFFMLLGSSSAHALARYFVGGSTATWNTTNSWSATSGGSSGATVPGSNDTAIFNGGSTNNCSIDANVNVQRIRMASGYTGTISQNAYTVTIGSGGFIVTSGTFTGSSSNITLSAALTVNGGTFNCGSGTLSLTSATVSSGTFTGSSGNITLTSTLTINGGTFTSTSGTLSTTSGITFSSGTFTHNSGTVEMKATTTLSGSPTFYNFSIAPTAANTTITVSNTPVVNNTFTLGGTKIVTINSGTLDCKGDITISNNQSTGGGTATVSITGTGTQTLTGSGTDGQGALPKVTVNKSSGTLNLASVFSVAGNWTHTAGTVSPGSSTYYVAATQNFGGSSFSLNNLTQKAGTSISVAASQTITVNGTYMAYCTFLGGTGTLDCKGNMTINTSDVSTSYTGNLKFSGTGNQTITGSSAAFKGYLPNVTIDKAATDTLFLAGTISQTGNWTRSSGVVAPGSSTMCITNTNIYGTQNWNNLIIASSSSSNIASTDTLRVLGNLTFNTTGAAVSLGGGTMHVKGNITMQHTVANTSSQSCTLVINGTGTQTLTGNGTAGTGMFCNIVIDKPATDTLYLSSVISVRGNWTYKRGIVNATTNASGVAFYGSNTVDAQGTAGNVMSFYNVQVYSGTVTLAGSLRTVNNFQINSSSTCSPGSNTIYVGGTWNNNGTFSASTSTVTFEGSGYRAVKKASAALETFYNMVLNRNYSAASLRLDCPVKVTNQLTLTKSKIKTSAAYYLELADNATVSGGHDSAYVHGPMRKTGNDAFTFPLGDTTLTSGPWHPLGISAPGSTTDQFEATYFARDPYPAYDTIHADTLLWQSRCEYWTLNRNTGTSSVQVTLNWNSNCQPHDAADLRIALYDGTQWTDKGQGASTLNWPTGSVTSSVSISFSPNPAVLTIGGANTKGSYATLQRTLDGGVYTTSGNAFYFAFDDEYNDQNASLSYRLLDNTDTDITATLIQNSNNTPVTTVGTNSYKLNLLTATGALPSGYYVLEVTNERNEKYFLRISK